MDFKDLSIYLQKLEKTASRNDMILLLAELFKKVSGDDIGKVMYLLQGRVVPLYVNLEMGMADKMLIKAISVAFDKDEKEAVQEFKRIGDIGELAEKLAKEAGHKDQDVTISHVYEEHDITSLVSDKLNVHRFDIVKTISSLKKEGKIKIGDPDFKNVRISSFELIEEEQITVAS